MEEIGKNITFFKTSYKAKNNRNYLCDKKNDSRY
jgi:hypothetical protein